MSPVYNVFPRGGRVAPVPHPDHPRPAQRKRPRAVRVAPDRFDPQLWRDREAGRPIYVWGGGPSLAKLDPAEMRGAATIATNHQVWATERLGFPVPDYWMFYDVIVCLEVAIDEYPLPRKLVMDSPARVLNKRGYRSAVLADGEDGCGKTYLTPGAAGGAPSADSHGIVMDQSTLHGAVHMAWILGGNPIHVRGLDGGPDPQTGRVHWWDSHCGDAGLSRTYRRQHAGFIKLFTAILKSGTRLTLGPDCPLTARLPASAMEKGAWYASL